VRVSRIVRFSAATAALVFLIAPLALGQSTSSGTTGAAAEAEAAATITLSPFEVSTSKDVGFVASSSLAGGRLAGELRDTPARRLLDAKALEGGGRADDAEAAYRAQIERYPDSEEP
jgi:hypothetical protein